MAILKLVPPTVTPNSTDAIVADNLIISEINYITNPYSNPRRLYGGYNFLCTSTEDIAMQFIAVRRYYNRTNYIPIRHIVLSIDSFYEYWVGPQHLDLIAKRFCYHVSQLGYQIAYGVHENTTHYHVHFIINTINIASNLLLPWNFKTEQYLYDTMISILKLNESYWKGKYPITTLNLCYN